MLLPQRAFATAAAASAAAVVSLLLILLYGIIPFVLHVSCFGQARDRPGYLPSNHLQWRLWCGTKSRWFLRVREVDTVIDVTW